MSIAKPQSIAFRARPKRRNAIVLLLFAVPFFATACSSAESDSEGRRIPSDAQVIADVTPADTENVVDVRVTAGGSGESYLHASDLVWTYDRGAIIRRNAQLPEAPDAVVAVGGLARYQLVGDEYVFRRFLTTYNEYEGIDAPSTKELMQFVEHNMDKVFVGRDHSILAIHSIKLSTETRWTWHTPNSFTAPFEIQYRQRKNDTMVEDRTDKFDIRFYRQSIDSPLQSLLATEVARDSTGTHSYQAAEIDRMKTLRTNFK